MRQILTLAAAIAVTSIGAAAAQESGGDHAGHAMAGAPSAPLPAACEAAAAEMEGAASMSGMEGMARGTEGSGPAEAGNMEAMRAMHGPMMRAAAIADPDLAFNCGMIAHHRGAIAMAMVELAHGTDERSRALAERIIADQQREIEAMTAWIEANAR